MISSFSRKDLLIKAIYRLYYKIDVSYLERSQKSNDNLYISNSFNWLLSGKLEGRKTRTWWINLEELKKVYQDLIKEEFEKYKKTGTLKEAFLEAEEIYNGEYPNYIIEELINNGFILKYDNNKYRTLLMDIAYRASDIRIKHGGTKYVLETNLELKIKPLLDINGVKFKEDDRDFNLLFNLVYEKIGNKNLVIKFFDSLIRAGVLGLSKHQFDSVVKLLKDEKDAIIHAPTGFGKTYAFLIPILVECLKYEKNVNGPIAVFFYPRKSLGSDQMGRFIKIIYEINKQCGTNITIGIDDGDTREIKNGDLYRGIKCPVHTDERLIVKSGKAYCKKGDHYLDFIRVTRGAIDKNPPNILITNIYTLQYRLSDNKYWRNGYLSNNIRFFVFDEIHAYRSLVAGILRYFIKILRNLVSNKSRIILSSATIPKIADFVYEIMGKSMEEVLDLGYDEKVHGWDTDKLELYLLIGINPYTSWETFTHELAIFLSTVNRLRSNKNLQSLIFVDSIKNIHRLYSQTHEALKLGDPKDHFDSDIPPTDPFCYWIYNEKYKTPQNLLDTSPKIEELRNDIEKNIGYHHSYRQDRFDIEDLIKRGKIDVVYTTSTLELGVDYDNTSVIVNTGIPFNLESIVQRVGRAGRKIDSTLNCSLSIIIVRNNPLEYYYLYKGIENLVDINKMPKIPISYKNHFVIIYSALLYIITSLVKQGEKFKGKKISALRQLLDYFDSNKKEIFNQLEIQEDIERTEREIKGLVEIIMDKNIEQKCKDIIVYINRLWLFKNIEKLKEELSNLINELNEKIPNLPQRDIKNFSKKTSELENILSNMEEIEDLIIFSELLEELIDILDSIKNQIRGGAKHPLFRYRTKLLELVRKSEKYLQEIGKYGEVSIDFEKNYGKYSRACELYRKLTTQIVKNIEHLIGFRFMGTDFIDQSVFIKPELQLGEGKEEFLTNVIYRMPPFELVNIPFEEKEQRKISNIVGARHVWLLKPRSFYIFCNNSMIKNRIYNSLDENSIVFGNSERLFDLMIPESIEFMDLLSTSPFILKTWDRKGRPLYIKYGSDILYNSKVDGRYELNKNISKLYSSKTSDNLYDLIHNKTISLLKQLDNSLSKGHNPWGINLRYVAMCKLGLCISTDPYDSKCPRNVRDDCSLPCDGKRLWNNRRKIFPKFYLKPKIGNLENQLDPLIFDIKTITYDELKDDIEFMYNNVYVYLPVGFSNYEVREIEVEPIGYRAKTSFLILKLNHSLLEYIINIILSSNDELKELLKYKYYMYKKYMKKGSSLEVSREIFKYDESKIDIKSEEFINFVKNSLIHTLTHMFYIFIVSEKIKLDPGRIVYFIDNCNIYLLENSKNDGIGMVETIRNEIEKYGKEKLLDELLSWIKNFLSNHDKHVHKAEIELKTDSKEYIKDLKTNIRDIIRIENDIEKINKKISSRVDIRFVDFITYRQLISQELDVPEDLSEYLLTIINSQDYPSLCFDGCNECIILYKECTEPFAQNYLLSKKLLMEFIKIMKRKTISIVGKNIGEIVTDIMQYSDEIIIKSPFIDDFGVKLLESLVRDGKRIKLITRSSNKQLVNDLEKLGITIEYLEGSHAKLYYFKNKNNEHLFIEGSLNLTKKDFYENENNISIFWDNSHIKSFISNVK